MGNTGGGRASIAQEIRALLDRRRARLPEVQAVITNWRNVDQQLISLSSALDLLRNHPSVLPDAAAGLAIPQFTEMRAQVAQVIEQYTAVEARFSRDTVNIGVSGSARMGKSTLLQSISGLGDEQIPTGRDLPVTAIRSRIYNSPDLRRAVLRLHSPESFLDEVIKAYHLELGFDQWPTTLDEFRTWNYPAELSDPKPDKVSLLARLRDIHAALWSYEQDLCRAEREMVVGLDHLRQFVAYPTHESQHSTDPVPRRYLAVRDARIDCAFPHAEVDRLGIIDLPGLGEIAAGAESHHVTGLRHEVDVVLLIKKASETSAFWTAADAQALKLLDLARGSIRNRGDFVYLVVNTPKGAESLADPLRAHITHQVNDGQPGKYFTVLDTDAAEPESVRGGVLSPLLTALAARLPVMDEECLAGAREAAAGTAAGIELMLADLTTAMRSVRAASGDVTETIADQARKLREDLAIELNALVAELRARVMADEDDPEYVSAIKAVYGDVVAWIEGGFGIGAETWQAAAFRAFGTDGSGRYADEQINRIRVEIGNRFAALDTFYSGQIERTRRDVGLILRRHCGDLLTGAGEGTALLTELADLLDNPRNPCPALHQAVTGLLALRMEYRSHLHPLLRPQLDGLRMQYEDPRTGRPVAVIVPELTEKGARDLYVNFTHLAENAAHEVRKALMAGEMTPVMVTYAAVEHFVDAFIRSGASNELGSPGSEREFERFARAYRDELWPGAYQGIAEGNVRYDRVMTLIDTLYGTLAEARRAA